MTEPLLRVGLTGNIGSGKSTVALEWRRLGAQVIDADQLAREAVSAGSAGLKRVVEVFGPGVLSGDGTLDRPALGRLVFDDDAARRDLEAIIHPEVQRLRQLREEDLVQRGCTVVVHEIPLLFEVGLDPDFDVIVLVDAPVDVRRRRLMETRGLDRARADAMIAAQMDAGLKRKRAAYVIDNDGTLDELRSRATEVWSALTAGRT